MKYLGTEEDRFHVVKNETNGCTTVITSSKHIPVFSKDSVEQIVLRIKTDIGSCVRPSSIPEHKWEDAKARLLKKMAIRIQDSNRTLRGSSSEEDKENCRWTVVTASDYSALSVMWNTTTNWYDLDERDYELELVDRVSIVLNATDASHRIGKVDASRVFVEAEEREIRRTEEEEAYDEGS